MQSRVKINTKSWLSEGWHWLSPGGGRVMVGCSESAADLGSMHFQG